jgi:hypothetical protein
LQRHENVVPHFSGDKNINLAARLKKYFLNLSAVNIFAARVRLIVTILAAISYMSDYRRGLDW